MSPGAIDRPLVRRHLLALDQALTRLEPRAAVPELRQFARYVESYLAG